MESLLYPSFEPFDLAFESVVGAVYPNHTAQNLTRPETLVVVNHYPGVFGILGE